MFGGSGIYIFQLMQEIGVRIQINQEVRTLCKHRLDRTMLRKLLADVVHHSKKITKKLQVKTTLDIFDLSIFNLTKLEIKSPKSIKTCENIPPHSPFFNLFPTRPPLFPVQYCLLVVANNSKSQLKDMNWGISHELDFKSRIHNKPTETNKRWRGKENALK